MAHVCQTIGEWSFSKSARTARKARRNGAWHEQGYRSYGDLAKRHVGGGQPQNVSPLNSKRRGDECLLASLPPQWVSRDVNPPWGVPSIFSTLTRREAVIRSLRDMLAVLDQTSLSPSQIQARRDACAQALIDVVVITASAFEKNLEPGWSGDERCDLDESEALWLDPYRDEKDFQEKREQQDWRERVCHRFANWVNAMLARKSVPVGDVEHAHWKALMRETARFFP